MVAIKKVACPTDKIKIKCPYEMEAEGVAIHDSANNATAMEEVDYMHSNNNKVSFHYAVDESEIVQGIEEDRNAWNAGDGTKGDGNRKHIAIEICRSYCKKKVNGKWVADEERWENDYKAKFEQAQRNAAELTAKILKEREWGIDRVKKHQDFNGKNCPHRTLSDYGWEYFLNLVNGYLNPTIKKSVDEIAKEVLAGKWGNGQARVNALEKAGYSYETVQKRVNELIAENAKKKTYSKGVAIKFSGKPLYKNSTTKKVSRRLEGTYYIYDGVKTNGRYRITNKKNRCGKKPTWMYVTGWVEL